MKRFSGADDSNRFELATAFMKKSDYPLPLTIYTHYFVVPEVKSTYIMKGNLINGSMMNVEKVQTDCRRSAFLLLVRTLADAVAVCAAPYF